MKSPTFRTLRSMSFSAVVSLASAGIAVPAMAAATVAAPTQQAGTTAGSRPAALPQPLLVAPTASATKTMVTTANLHLRTSATTRARSLGVMPKGTTVTWTGKSSNGWKQIKWGSRTGWSSGAYLKPKSTSTASAPGRKGVVAYSQTAASWKNKVVGKYRFGPSGCVPTSFAMVARSYSKKVTPLSVGIKMHAISDFNRTIAGAGGKSVVAAGKAYGLKVTPLTSTTKIKAALLKNKPVLAALRGPSSVISPGYTHEVVLNGYSSSGTTTVINPLGATKRSYSLNTLWTWRSFDKIDRNAGGGATFWQVG